MTENPLSYSITTESQSPLSPALNLSPSQSQNLTPLPNSPVPLRQTCHMENFLGSFYSYRLPESSDHRFCLLYIPILPPSPIYLNNDSPDRLGAPAPLPQFANPDAEISNLIRVANRYAQHRFDRPQRYKLCDQELIEILSGLARWDRYDSGRSATLGDNIIRVGNGRGNNPSLRGGGMRICDGNIVGAGLMWESKYLKGAKARSPVFTWTGGLCGFAEEPVIKCPSWKYSEVIGRCETAKEVSEGRVVVEGEGDEVDTIIWDLAPVSAEGGVVGCELTL